MRDCQSGGVPKSESNPNQDEPLSSLTPNSPLAHSHYHHYTRYLFTITDLETAAITNPSSSHTPDSFCFEAGLSRGGCVRPPDGTTQWTDDLCWTATRHPPTSGRMCLATNLRWTSGTWSLMASDRPRVLRKHSTERAKTPRPTTTTTRPYGACPRIMQRE